MHKRRKQLKLVAIFLVAIFLCVCSSCTKKVKDEQSLIFYGFSVHVLDVGEGDCILIRLSDGKNMLIDSGDKSDKVSDCIINFLVNYGVEKLDYFVITHPDSDHCGNALDIINKFSVGTAFVPDMLADRYDFYQTYKTFYQKLLIVAEEIKTSDCYKIIKNEDYAIAFLTPNPKSFDESSYRDFNEVIEPLQEQSNALSPIIYLEYCGVRFLFTGDAPVSQEKLALKQVELMGNYYDTNGISVNLENIDFLKVSHHGADDASSLEFLQAIMPENAIISVGGNNNYGHPNRNVLERLETVNPDYKLYRTDVHGAVSVNVNSDGSYQIITDKKIT